MEDSSVDICGEVPDILHVVTVDGLKLVGFSFGRSWSAVVEISGF